MSIPRGAFRTLAREPVADRSPLWDMRASEIIAYPPGIAGVSPTPRVADKIGPEARQLSWIHACRACHLPKLKCSIIPLCIGQAKPTAPASVNAKLRYISYSNQGGGGVKRTKRTFFKKFPGIHPLTARSHRDSRVTTQNPAPTRIRCPRPKMKSRPQLFGAI